MLVNPFSDGDFHSASPDAGSCVEVAISADIIGVRDSKSPAAAVLLFTPVEWAAFLGGVKRGEFDLSTAD